MGKRPRAPMPMSARAAQFAPFSALTGLEEALREEERLHDRVSRPILSEEAQEEINAVLTSLEPGDAAEIRYWADGGIVLVSGSFESYDAAEHVIRVSGEPIPVGDITGAAAPAAR